MNTDVNQNDNDQAGSSVSVSVVNTDVNQNDNDQAVSSVSVSVVNTDVNENNDQALKLLLGCELSLRVRVEH